MASTRQQIKSTVSSSITFEYNRQNTAELLTAVLFEIIDNVFNLAEDEVTIAQVTDLAATLSNKADLVAGKVPAEQLPAFSAFWGTMQKAADNNQTVEQAISAAVAAVVNASPATLDTLNELAAALGNDANFSATITAALATKIPTAEKGVANGVATLDATGKVPASQLPETTTAEATEETITLASGTAAITINTEAPAKISGAAKPGTVAVNTSGSKVGKGRILTIVADGTAEPTITGAVKFSGTDAAIQGTYKTTAGTLNRLCFLVDLDAAGSKGVYYFWR